MDLSMIWHNDFHPVGSNDGQLFWNWIDLLVQPGLQYSRTAKDAVKTHLLYLRIWDYFDPYPNDGTLGSATNRPVQLP